ncbi:MAG: phosphopyruvate hydratase [Candidatus Berkelbacteria bacterium]|nr:MAG: phosphopyruvate hydratase [Candidatus Berkelbacteria bacterium]QQG51379.1 MAG: phosphopyruvate hydratase [Candidatus Berkelbacteria bacterium]
MEGTNKATIESVVGEIIHDSRGDETLQATVRLSSGSVATSAVPGGGGSKGKFEAVMIDPKQSVAFIKDEIERALVGKDPTTQQELDGIMRELDGTADKSRLGANTILSVSLALARVSANELKLPLYRYIGFLDSRQAFSVPIPMMNLINGGKHADNNLEIQEFMVIPDRIETYHAQLSAGKLIFSTLGQMLRAVSPVLPIGDEGGYAPMLDTNEIAMDYLRQAIVQSGYKPWDEVSIALDIAASSLPETFEISPERYLGLLKDFPILSIEDPFGEEAWDDWATFRTKMDESNSSFKKLMLVGDDLFVTNPERLRQGIDKKAANSILVKLNQIGTVSETLEVIQIARQAGYLIVVSHRSGETLDDFIADFAVGVGAQFIKTGCPNDAHPERMTKYRRLLTIEQELGHAAIV